MPEFPEVYTITKDLKHIAEGKLIKKVELHGDYETLPNNKEFTQKVENQKILKIKQIAKNINLELENDRVINIHLGMSGQVLAKKKNKTLRWERVTFTLVNPRDEGKKLYLAYRSIRKFGKVELLNKSEYKKLKGKYGPSPIAEELTLDKFLKIIKSKNTNIKNLLMGQEKIGGLGNIYATEALFRAKLHPETRTKNISRKTAEKLLQEIKNVINEGIENRGSTLSDELYRDIYGKKGTQQKHFQIYGKEQCPSCKGKVKKKKISGRNTYFCPSCQKLENTEKKLL